MTKHLRAARTTQEEESKWYEQVGLSYEAEVTLGPGYPNFAPPDFVVQALVESVKDTSGGAHQYTSFLGHPRLVKALSTLYGRLLGHPVDPMTEIAISSGAFNGLFCTLMGLINPGDEVIICEPYYEAFKLFVSSAGGIPVYVSLRPARDDIEPISSSDWVLDMKEIESKLTEKTKCIILNNPLNPLGKVFSRSELESISRLAIKHDLLVISDEVYEFLLYDQEEHIRIASLPDMWCRTITVSSASKSFGVTGWRVGWVYGPAKLMEGIQRMVNEVSRCNPTPIQAAVAKLIEDQLPLLNTNEGHFNQMKSFLEEKRDRLLKVLVQAGFKPIVPQGGYFIVADYTNLSKGKGTEKDGVAKDYSFASWMAKVKKLHVMPMTLFYCNEHIGRGERYLRFCFVKDTSTLAKAEEILMTLRK